MRNLGKFLYQFYKWLIFVPILGLSTAFFSILALAISPFSQRFANRWCGFFWARLNAYAAPCLVSVYGHRHADSHRAFVIVANHQSQFDILVLYGWLGLDLKWVMKKELRKIPFMGICAEKMGHIIIDRSDTEAAVASINAAKEKLSDGTSVIFFPEGTRSRTGLLGPFKKGAFRLAMDLGLPILPVSLSGTRQVLPPDGVDLLPGSVQMIIHPPIDTSAYAIDQLDALMDQTRKVIESAL